MAVKSKGGVYKSRNSFLLRITIGPQKRLSVSLPWMTSDLWEKHDANTEACPCAACVRARDVQAMATSYRTAGADAEMIEALVRTAAPADADRLAAIHRAVAGFCEGRIQKPILFNLDHYGKTYVQYLEDKVRELEEQLKELLVLKRVKRK